jgi:N-acetylneuraminate synthase
MLTHFPFLEEGYIQTNPYPIVRKLFFIAEIGINHNGDIELAKKIIRIAKTCGCDAVKFQKRTIDTVYSAEELNKYRESPWGTTQREQKQKLEFGRDEYDQIDRYCREIGIEWFASAWDFDSLEFLRRYDCPYNKVASALCTYTTFVKEVAKEKRPTFVSVGMCTDEQIDSVVEIFRESNCPIILMHTVSEYPAPLDALNLQAIHRLRARYGLPVGYSGHEPNVAPSLIAAAYGAVAIERHVTLDRTMYGSDQAASLSAQGLSMLVNQLRTIPRVTGDGERIITEKEKQIAQKLRYFEKV